MSLRLTEQAVKDLQDLFDYTEDILGFAQAEKNVTTFQTCFQTLTTNPKIGRSRNEIKTGLYSLLNQKHIIFYRIKGSHVVVIRIIHGSRDLPKQF